MTQESAALRPQSEPRQVNLEDDPLLHRQEASTDPLVRAVRELTQRVGQVENELQQQREHATRLGPVEESLRQLRDLTASLRESIQSIDEEQERLRLVQTADTEAHKRGSADLSARLTEVAKGTEATQSRVAVLTEDVRQGQRLVAPFNAATEDLNRKHAELINRLNQADEQIRRLDARVSDGAERQEQVQTAINRQENGQRLADVRVTRELADWQQRLQTWKEELAEQTKPISQISSRFQRAQEVSQGLSAQVSELRHVVEEQASLVQKLDSYYTTTRDSVSRIEHLGETLRRRQDDFASAVTRADDANRGSLTRVAHLEQTVGQLLSRLDEATSLARSVDAQRFRTIDELARIQRQLEELRGELADRLASLEDRVSSALKSFAERLVEINELELTRGQRELTAAQQHLDDIKRFIGADQSTS